ncbi:MAG TPA: CRTAC1 family protein, partial [Isosphaeraceae bacterium]
YFSVGSRKTGPNKLYKNLGGGKFKDVTKESGLGFEGYCHGIIAGDLDNDGDQDVFLCNCGPNKLYLNNGNGTFTDISKSAGIDRDGWSSGGALLDYDNDGDLDIYVTNYGKWKLPEDDVFCGDKEKGVRLYCTPRTIKTVKHFFYRNNGDNTFTDVYDQVIFDPVAKAFRGRDDGHGFGVVACDIDLDGKIDLWVANDMNPNFTFKNTGKGTFEDITDTAGAALNLNGQTQSGMGVDAEDVNGDGLPELFVTNFSNEPDTLYQNLGKASFLDTTTFFGLAADSMPYVKWGTGLFDFDGDGWPDCFVTNGHVDDNRRLLGQAIEYEEPPLLHRNIDGRRFKLSTRGVGPYFDAKHVGRGAAFGDIDDDGDIDIVVNHKDAPPAVLRNDTPMNGSTWIRLDLVGTKSNRDAIGTLIKVQVGPRTIWRQRKGGCSMLSTNDGRVLIGLGKAPLIDKITLRWPSGTEQVLENVKPNQTLEVVEPKVGAVGGGK